MKSLELFDCLMTDVMRQHPQYRRALMKDLSVIHERVKHEGFTFLSVTLPKLGDAVFSGLESGNFACPTSFRKKGSLPLLLGGLIALVFDSSGRVRSDVDPCILHEIRQITYFFKKSLGTDKQEEILNDAACDSFFQTDEDCFDDGQDIPHSLALQRIARVLWRPTSFEDLRRSNPKNGPGGVSESLKTNEKYRHILGSIPDDMLWILDSPYIEMYGESSGNQKQRHCYSRLVSVPKNSTSRRTITVEPATNMFVQQQLNEVIRAKISLSPLLASSLALNDQSVSQKRALESSLHRKYATVDLSSASDLLSNSLVKLVFSHDTVLLEALQQSRTEWVTGPKWSWKLKKYAGMGNATTFPVQSIVFAVLSVYAICVESGQPLTRKRIVDAVRQVTVYGDDIILPSTAYGVLIDILASLRLRVNTKKSFVSSHFRESCGVDAYAGCEITPTYLRRVIDAGTEPSAILTFISTANQLWMKGYYSASTFLKDHVESLLGRLPLVRKSSGCIGWTTRVDAQTYGRFNKTYQRFETRSFVSKPCYREDKLESYPRLLMNLLTNGQENQVSPDKTSLRYANTLRRRWAT